jgi:threonine dehydrogenase-like Zn-dependent dehydrogenase
VPVRATISVAVIGDGKLGLLCAQVVALTGATNASDRQTREKLRIAARRGIETSTPKDARNEATSLMWSLKRRERRAGSTWLSICFVQKANWS